MFGPISFDGLNLPDNDENFPFDYEGAAEKVINNLENNMYLPNSLCIHGFMVKIKKRNLKRRSTLLKHARFLKNLEVFPC